MLNLLASVEIGDVIVLLVLAAMLAMVPAASRIQQRHAEEDAQLRNQQLAKSRADWERRNKN